MAVCHGKGKLRLCHHLVIVEIIAENRCLGGRYPERPLQCAQGGAFVCPFGHDVGPVFPGDDDVVRVGEILDQRQRELLCVPLVEELDFKDVVVDCGQIVDDLVDDVILLDLLQEARLCGFGVG